MKKQLSLIVLVLALFAGFSSVSAQCVGSGFTPASGVPYVYTVTVPTTLGYTGNGTYDWYVTQEVDLLDASGIIPESNVFFTVDETTIGYSDYHDVANTTSQIALTWTPAAVSSATPFYLVLKYSETNPNATPACIAENIRVWQIDPINTFLLAIEGANTDGTPFANAEQCAAPIIGATVTPAAGANPTSVEYTYGENTLFYRITASGILGQWRPSIRIPALAGLGQNYIAVEWNQNITGAGTWESFNVPAGNTTGGDFVSTNNAVVSDAVAGTPILVRVRIANENFETLADQPILVGVDGYLPTAYTESDITGGTGPTACDPEVAFGKQATYTILARPTINPGATMPAFIVKLP
ncbi:MAG: hypothetical protein JNL22_11300 [Bacteroidales bacterium]|jgi:hypothetical protein|nr:hypothetical protein [Bacteroidales bacterium]